MIAALCCLVLSVTSVIWLIVLTDSSSGLSEPTFVRFAHDAPAALQELVSENSFEAIIDRPLFQPSRRPVQILPSVEQVSRLAPPQRELEGSLLGVVIRPDRHIAILRLMDSGSVIVPEGGEVVAGWTLEKVNPDRVVLKSGDRSIEWLFPKHAAAGTKSIAAEVGWPLLQRR